MFVPGSTFPTAVFESGITDLVSVIPPGAQLVPSSKIPQQHLGKVPGRRYGNGLWGGYDWRRHQPTIDDVRAWEIAGASLGVRGDRFPAIDIDCTDAQIASIVERIALDVLGDAPVRVGKAPKRLLMYRTATPFGRMRLWFRNKGEQHLVEVLGSGQQYLVHGTHPSTLQPYSWSEELTSRGAEGLTEITRERADEFLRQLATALDANGVLQLEREGDGRASARTAAADQTELLAPSIEALCEAVALIPNTNELFPDRTSYLRMGYAIRAACGEHTDDGFALFAAWADKWEGNDRVEGNEPEVVLNDWRRFRAPYAVGWSWIGEQARPFGFNDAGYTFAVNPDAELPGAKLEHEAPPEFSDRWCAQHIVARQRTQLRFSAESGRWFIWNGTRWQPDAELQAENLIDHELAMLATKLMQQGATQQEKAKAEKEARALASASKSASVASMVKRDRSIAVPMSALDADPWVLNTPGGIIDLRTGELLAPDPEALCTKSTAVSIDGDGDCPEWRRFLVEATGRDIELEAYLQRLAGYALTGITSEQQLTFIWGPGGNGKSVFLNTVAGILGDYARTASMDTFTASKFDRHTTELAMLQGARLVSASETQEGKRWDEARIKSLTGGDLVTARYMRQDNFTFRPQFKLMFAGNHQPGLGTADRAMRRRMHMVPFTAQPARVDHELEHKLRAEWPAILAWMLEGCQAWQDRGLAAPARVLESTNEYFAEQDGVQRWLDEECDVGPDGFTESTDLYRSWFAWCASAGEIPRTQRELSAALVSRGFRKGKHPVNRRAVFYGIHPRTSEAVPSGWTDLPIGAVDFTLQLPA